MIHKPDSDTNPGEEETGSALGTSPRAAGDGECVVRPQRHTRGNFTVSDQIYLGSRGK